MGPSCATLYPSMQISFGSKFSNPCAFLHTASVWPSSCLWPPVTGCHNSQPHGHNLTSAVLITESLRPRALQHLHLSTGSHTAFPQRCPLTAEAEHHEDQARAFAKTRHPRMKCLWFSGVKLGTVLSLTKRRSEELIKHQPAFTGIPALYNRVWSLPGSFGSSTVHPCSTHTPQKRMEPQQGFLSLLWPLLDAQNWTSVTLRALLSNLE